MKNLLKQQLFIGFFVFLLFTKISTAEESTKEYLDTLDEKDIGIVIGITTSSSKVISTLDQQKENLNLKLKLDIKEKAQIQPWLRYYKKRAYHSVKIYVNRGKPYIPVIKQIFQKYQIPDDFVFLPIIESHFNIKAKSPAGAAGLWQFIPQTGKMYGLLINKWVDERLDPVESTKAAALYLKDLYNIFDDWMLALASYNTGEGLIIRKINKYGGTNFWDIHEYLSKETRNYVPSFLAVVQVVKEMLKKEDFNYEDISFETVKTKAPLSLKFISQTVGIPYKTLEELNPHLKKGITPPNIEHYHIYVPKGFKLAVETVLEKTPLQKYRVLKEYSVKKGDSLLGIAKKFGTTVKYLKKINNIKSNILIADSFIKVPSYIQAYPLYTDKILDLSEDIVYTSKGIIYKVKKGDTLASISKKFRVSIKQLKRWNKIDKYIYPNQKIVIYRKIHRHLGGKKIVKRNIKYLKKIVKKRKPTFKYIYYKVKKGDSLSLISKKFGVPISDIKKWNNIKGNIIVIGETLTIIKRVASK
ncbi:MAG: LysM peptidoglycan-binding domain-containing protein [Aquificae bacterium]|nr:LysM peptidoglycan-binding domain-containing protein [Aquificota bacterium]